MKGLEIDSDVKVLARELARWLLDLDCRMVESGCTKLYRRRGGQGA